MTTRPSIGHGLAVLATVLALLGLLAPPAAAQEIPFASSAFQAIWERYDRPVQQGQDPRSWTWGPASIWAGLEPYVESPGGRRQVQYFDKARMEINTPTTKEVTNGLLVRELVSGRIAFGDVAAEPGEPAAEAVAGDPAGSNANAPTYATFRQIASLNNDRRSPDRVGQVIDQSIDKSGALGGFAGGRARYAYYDPNLGHNVADVFWRFLNQEGTIVVDGRSAPDRLVYDPWYFAMGLPITEPYWTTAQVRGLSRAVLVQLFERRVLTYTPDNPPEWQVEMGNVGQHYYRWRYQHQQPLPPGAQAPTFIAGPQRTALTATSATIEWETDQEATSRLEYDTERDRVQFRFQAGGTSFRTQHQVTITDLTPDTVYYWRVISRNRDGLQVPGELHSFKTLVATTITQPRSGDTVTSPLIVRGVEDGTAASGALVVRLKHRDTGVVLVEAPAAVQSTGNRPGPYEATLTFTAPATTIPGVVEVVARSPADGTEEVKAGVTVTIMGAS